jgi:hypothetical protein
MQQQDNENRPPRLRFELVSTEDRQASIEKGHYVGVDEEIVYLTPHGSKDEIPKNPVTWLEQSAVYMQDGRLSMEMLRFFQDSYKRWKEGLDAPVMGTDIKVAGFIKPTELKQLISAGIRSVEELASASEESMNLIGMGGRALKEKAKIWLGKDDKGKYAEQIVFLQQAVEELKEAMKSKDEIISAQAKKLKER